MFQRDLRLAAKSVYVRVCSLLQPDQTQANSLDSGLKFDSSGLYVPNPRSVAKKKKDTDIYISSNRRRDSQLIFPRSEKEIFDIIGIPWVDPTLRNTDA